MSADQWFPRWSPSGARLACGSQTVSVDGVEVGPGTSPKWLYEGEVVYTRQPDGALLHWPSGAVLDAAGFNDTDACNGRWAGWNAKRDEIVTSWGLVLPGCRMPRLSATGLVYAQPVGDGWRIVGENGRVLGEGAIRDLRVSWDGVVVWSQDVDGIWETTGLGALHLSAGDEFWPVPLDASNWDSWVLSHTHTALWLRPWGATVGYVVHEGVTDFPDAVWTPQGWKVAWSDRGVLRQRTISHDTPRVVLVDGVPVPPEPSTPPVEPPSGGQTMWTDQHAALLGRFANTFLCPGGPGQDEAAREWTRKAAEQFAFTFPREGWGHKRADGGRPPSTDVIATRSPFQGYDLILSQGRPDWSINYQPSPLPLAGQVFLEVVPTNHLGEVTPPVEPPVEPPSSDVEARLRALEQWRVDVGRFVVRTGTGWPQ